jgi:hypothetical protein
MCRNRNTCFLYKGEPEFFAEQPRSDIGVRVQSNSSAATTSLPPETASFLSATSIRQDFTTMLSGPTPNNTCAGLQDPIVAPNGKEFDVQCGIQYKTHVSELSTVLNFDGNIYDCTRLCSQISQCTFFSYSYNTLFGESISCTLNSGPVVFSKARAGINTGILLNSTQPSNVTLDSRACPDRSSTLSVSNATFQIW